MKKTLIAAVLASTLGGNLSAGIWKGLDEANWYAGTKLTEAALANKVVLVYSFSGDDEVMPRIQQLWNSFKTKPFVIVASHKGGKDATGVAALVEKHKLTMPVYEGFGYALEAPSAPLYLVNHHGLVIWSGNDDREATDAFVTAIGDVGRPPDLLRGVALPKRRARSLKSQFVFGKSIKSALKPIEKEIAAYEKNKKPSKKQTDRYTENKAILESVESAKARIKAEIIALKKINPEESAKMAKSFAVTFPGVPLE